ncbi:NUDIX hydrolase [Actinomycetes bacterium KLBMP 9797]
MTDADGWRLPEALVARIRQHHAGEAGPPATPRAAATVALLRPAASGFEVYLLRRAASMAFASGMYVFPGGSVDPADADAAVPSPDEWARRLGRPPEEAGAVVAAAMREVFEETGVRLRPELLEPWARWITPEFEARRFDTYFFVAALPEGEQPRDISGEADQTLWISPAEAVAGYEAGEIAMLPPTIVLVRALSTYPDVAAVLRAAADRDAATPVTPRVELSPDGTVRFLIS